MFLVFVLNFIIKEMDDGCFQDGEIEGLEAHPGRSQNSFSVESFPLSLWGKVGDGYKGHTGLKLGWR